MESMFYVVFVFQYPQGDTGYMDITSVRGYLVIRHWLCLCVCYSFYGVIGFLSVVTQCLN
jgi:hypothetical protein